MNLSQLHLGSAAAALAVACSVTRPPLGQAAAARPAGHPRC
jgi:hypothetical protein